MIVKKCDICGAEMRMTTPRYKVIFYGWLYKSEKDICVSCFERIKAEIQTADTPQTDKDKVVCPNCGRSDYIRSFEKDFNIMNSGYRYKCINCNTYIKDTPQTERSE